MSSEGSRIGQRRVKTAGTTLTAKSTKRLSRFLRHQYGIMKKMYPLSLQEIGDKANRESCVLWGGLSDSIFHLTRRREVTAVKVKHFELMIALDEHA